MLDGAAFDQLYRTNRDRLKRWAMRLLPGDASGQADLMQDALCAAWQHRGQFAVGTNFAAWLAIIMRNRVYSATRRQRKVNAAIPCMSMSDDAFVEMVGVSGAQEAVVALREMDRMIAALPKQEREALLLVMEMPHDAIAERQSVPVGTVKCRVFRARRRLMEKGAGL